ncbi:phosphoenolpyruvate--protein phosphotransferase [Polyangium spumosum]|uniref:Phosphoenolpyruvate-protein phosphotransferase n=1 Tax=Polyangium spumosum TaxID=889282 RepID=A0A6N7PKD8_9BACT|nr:phosphoenolpyruvate--protein phosphotransferase [Polyangium spumosum]MRG92267.1 phosphoenolpyruvate--protein phosphotransferase [Polyangium spumosum]
MSAEPPSKTAEVLRGIAGSPGVAIGKVVVFGLSRAPCPRRTIGEADVDAEITRFEEAVARAQRDLREMSQRLTERSAEASILEAYVLMTGDPVLAEAVRHQIRKEKRGAEWAVAEASDAIAKRLAALDDPYLSERSHDVMFIGDRILRAFGTSAPEQPHLRLDGPSIIVAHDLSPADTAAMINQPVVGFVTEVGTRTSHTAIMARALEIPAVVGVTDALARIRSGDLVVVDGLRGSVLVRPQARELDEARARGERHTALSRELSVSRDREATTQDGLRVTLRANVELPAEAILARDHGAEGIGLYRTEFLYIDRSEPPTEEQQFEIFRAVVETMRPMPVTLRTFDIGGDKFISSLKLPPEMNPMLGLRAVRLALSQPEVFLEHLRAMVRASAYGEVKIMIPMIASLSELRQVRVLLDQAIAQVKARGLPCAEEIPLGVMIEVPAAAVLVDLFAQEASFMSLGTNDLVQYTLAVDRTSRSLAYLASSFDPSILRLIRSVVRAGEGWSCPVSICGAMASDPLAAVLLVGLGMRDFSMEAAAIPEIKEALRRVTLVEAEAVAREALRFGTSDEVEHCVAEAFAPRLYDLLTGER